uniref:Uncharacterized protein n=1 Tax=Aegilops tauschii subsp. strangulata TaxID=200361 RepID=A0A453IDT9_AEGTS
MMQLTTISINFSCTQCSRVNILSTFYCVTCVYSFFNASLQLLGVPNCRLNYLDLPMYSNIWLLKKCKYFQHEHGFKRVFAPFGATGHLVHLKDCKS